MITFKDCLDYKWLGVISRIGLFLGIPASKLRIFFIYSVFATIGASFLLYLIIAFMFYLKDCIIIRRPSVFDL